MFNGTLTTPRTTEEYREERGCIPKGRGRNRFDDEIEN